MTALQQSCQPIGKLLIQGAINSLGVATIAAFNAVNKVDAFALVPEQSIIPRDDDPCSAKSWC